MREISFFGFVQINVNDAYRKFFEILPKKLGLLLCNMRCNKSVNEFCDYMIKQFGIS
jgi:hypothetical protein